MGQVAVGDHAAFTELYRRTRHRADWVAHRVLRNPDQAAEVVQDTYLYVWQHAARYTPHRGSVNSWLSTLVHGRAVDRVRSTVAAANRDTRDARRSDRTSPDIGHGVADHVTAQIAAHQVRRAVNTLSAVQREALTLTYFHGYTHTQAAQVLAVPLGTLKSRVRDGLSTLRSTDNLTELHHAGMF